MSDAATEPGSPGDPNVFWKKDWPRARFSDSFDEPRAWSEAEPTEEGWYWVHFRWCDNYGNKGSSSFVEYVHADSRGAFYWADTSGMLVEDEDGTLFKDVAADKNGKWWFHGPLKPPEDPQ